MAPCTLLRPWHLRIAPARQVLRTGLQAVIPRQPAFNGPCRAGSDSENVGSSQPVLDRPCPPRREIFPEVRDDPDDDMDCALRRRRKACTSKSSESLYLPKTRSRS